MIAQVPSATFAAGDRLLKKQESSLRLLFLSGNLWLRPEALLSLALP
ncbi:hypothetical protein [Mesorhizobium sp. ZC-5]|nr:hypothetical protein [Mesorhizobium sp. ZC-5]MCV3241746.1 hypothetical protein [Mesorhizobium sp. ZC-5]